LDSEKVVKLWHHGQINESTGVLAQLFHAARLLALNTYWWLRVVVRHFVFVFRQLFSNRQKRLKISRRNLVKGRKASGSPAGKLIRWSAGNLLNRHQPDGLKLAW